MPSIPDALAAAIQHHQAGRLQAAEQIYRQISAGACARGCLAPVRAAVLDQVGKQDLAVEYIGYAIRLNPGAWPPFIAILASRTERLTSWRKRPRLVAAGPNRTPTMSKRTDLGNVLREQGQLDQAVVCYRRALELNPDSPATYYNFGTALSDQGCWLMAWPATAGHWRETGLSRCAGTTCALP